jgi:hypothetical protein
MKLKMYSVKDVLAEIYNKPFCEINDATASRVFKQSISESPHPDDFILYCVGEYYDHLGEVVPCEPYRVMLEKEKNNNNIEAVN